ncbi:MAG: hypothetical protein WCO65_02285 [bacterium]
MTHIINTNEVPNLRNNDMLFSHDKHGIIEWDKQKFELHVCEEDISWDDLMKYLESQKEKIPLNATVYDFLIKHPEEIPDEAKDTDEYIHFVGSILYCDHGRGFRAMDVRCMCFYKFHEDGRVSEITRITALDGFRKGARIALYRK